MILPRIYYAHDYFRRKLPPARLAFSCSILIYITTLIFRRRKAFYRRVRQEHIDDDGSRRRRAHLASSLTMAHYLID